MKKISNLKILIIILLLIILCVLIVFTIKSINSNTTVANNDNNKTSMLGNSNSSVETSGSTEITDKQSITSGTYQSATSDQSAIVVSDDGDLTLSNAIINKSSGDSSNTENSEFYGLNAALLVKASGTATIKNATIATSAKGANAVFSTGTDSKVYISDSTITTTGSSSSRGLDATYGGYIEADNVKITTQGGSCATLATDRGEGTVIANNMTLETNGAGSPLIYSTGDIQLSNSTGISNGSQLVVIEGKNSAKVTNSNLTSIGKGNRNDVDNCGVMLYQSMSGDASTGTATFTGKDSSLAISNTSSYYQTSPFFFVTNTKAEINLENCILNYGSGKLLSIGATSEWGNSGSNGGDVTLNAKNQELIGDISVDNISTLNLNLTNGSTYKGNINTKNTAKSIQLTIDSNSKITLTGDTYVTSLNDSDSSYSNIDFNGYKLYVNGTAIN